MLVAGLGCSGLVRGVRHAVRCGGVDALSGPERTHGVWFLGSPSLRSPVTGVVMLVGVAGLGVCGWWVCVV